MADLPSYYDAEAEISPDERKRRESCSSKATYGSAELARAAAVQAEWSTGELASGLKEYVCRFCSKWHLSRKA